MDHSWPADLDEPDAACEYCGLYYTEWSTEDPGCPGPIEPVFVRSSSWQIDMISQIVVVSHHDKGSEWEDSVVFGPFETVAEADAFAAEHDRLGNMAPDFTVVSEVTQLHTTTKKEAHT